MIHKLITVVNWTAIAFLAYLVGANLIFPDKSSDTSGKFWVQLALGALMILLVLNLLPYKWAKYTAFSIVLLPFALSGFGDFFTRLKQDLRYSQSNYDGSRYFADPQRKLIARAISEEDVQELEGLLRKPVPLLNDFQNSERITLLDYTAWTYSPYGKDWNKNRRMLESLLAAGATINSDHPQRLSTHTYVISSCPAAMLAFFLDHGADPNAKGHDRMSLLYESILSSNEPVEKVKVLLDHGVPPTGTETFDVESESYSPLLLAAHIQRWDVCWLLVQRGADIEFKAPNGLTLLDYLKKQEASHLASSSTPSPEFKALQDWVANRLKK